MTTEQQKLIDGLADDLRPMVQSIEARPATTRGHYGDYGSLISTLAKGSNAVAIAIAFALVKAGADKQGVHDGLTILAGFSLAGE